MVSSNRIFLCGATRSATYRISSSGVTLTLEHDERLRHLTRFLIGAGNHGGVGDGGMREQDCLELRRRHLVALVLDQLLQSIDDEEVTIVVRMADVSAMEPAILVKDLLGRGAVVQVALHDLRSADPELTV